MKKIAVTSVYANPLHPGHVECFELSKALADELWVIVNNDHQARLKRGTESFQDENFRMNLVASLKPVDKVILSIDTDASVCATLETVFKELKAREDVSEIIFTKGGDRFANNIPEIPILEKYEIKLIDGLGAKTHSSSSLVNRIANQKDQKELKEALETLPEDMKEKDYIEVGVRPWGVYYVMEDKPNFKVKKIIVNPGARLSLQSHNHRSEHWVVVQGTASVQTRRPEDPSHVGHRILYANESCYIPKGYVHRLGNTEKEPLVIVEVQLGDYMGEDDIVRYEDDYSRTTEIPDESKVAK